MPPRTVWLVDDDLLFTARLESQLRASGFAVQSFDNGEELPWPAERPDCVVVNFGAASDDRAAVVRRLKSEPGLPSIPVLAFAGHLETERHRRARAAGADKVVANSAIKSRAVELIEITIARVTSGAPIDDTVDE